MADVHAGPLSLIGLEDELTCSICLSPFDCPVTIPCGHNFCQGCLLAAWKDSYSCPQCRTHFATRPELKKNTVLSSVVQSFTLRKSESQAPPRAEQQQQEEEEDDDVVRCDACMEAEASQTCLTCMASYCEEHLRPHRDNPAFRLHQLSRPLGDLSERICPDHHKLMELFCSQHSRPICSLCLQQVHKGCPFISPEERRNLTESDLRAKLDVLDGKITKNENVLRQMDDLQNKLKDSATNKKMALSVEYQQIQDMLAREERESLTAVDRELQSCQSKLKAQAKKFSENVKNMSKAKEEVHGLLSQNHTLAFLQASFDLPPAANFEPFAPQLTLDSKSVTATQAFSALLKEHLTEMLKQPVEARLLLLRPGETAAPGSTAASSGSTGSQLESEETKSSPKQKKPPRSRSSGRQPTPSLLQPFQGPHMEPQPGWSPHQHPQGPYMGPPHTGPPLMGPPHMGPPYRPHPFLPIPFMGGHQTKQQWTGAGAQPKPGPKKKPQKQKAPQATEGNAGKSHPAHSTEDLMQGTPKEAAGRGAPVQDEGWNTVPISKNRPIDTSRLSKITKTPVLDFNNQLLAPGGKGTWGSWGKGSSGGTTAKPAELGPEPAGRPATSTINRFSALQQSAASSGPAAPESDRRVPQRNSSSRERGGADRFDRDRNRLPITKRSFSRETEEREQRGSADPVRRVASMTDDRGSRERARSKENVKRETAATPPPPPTPTKPALSEEELSKKSTAIIEEYLHINDMKEALQCVQEMNSAQLLFVFVRNGLESTLERSTIVRERIGLLLQQLVKSNVLQRQQYYTGLQEILEVAEDMSIDIPHIWLYLAEQITPMLHEGGIPMGDLFREISKPLVPQGQAGVLLVQILTLLCKGMSHKKAGAMWREAGLRWKDFLPEDKDVNKFVTEQRVEFTLANDSEKEEEGERKELSPAEISKQLERLIQDQADDQRLFDWVEANLDEQQSSSSVFVRSLMTCVCQSAVVCENPNKVDGERIKERAKVLHRYLKDEQLELQALYALQALMVQLEQPANLLRMFFDALYDEDVIKEEAFFKWETSKDPAEQQGKGVALKSVTAFFTWLREAEDESDNS